MMLWRKYPRKLVRRLLPTASNNRLSLVGAAAGVARLVLQIKLSDVALTNGMISPLATAYTANCTNPLHQSHHILDWMQLKPWCKESTRSQQQQMRQP